MHNNLPMTDKESMEKMWPGGDITFGVTDPDTGEFKEGHYDKKGMMIYRNPLPWYKRLLGAKKILPVWGAWEYVTSVDGTRWAISGGLFSQAQKHEWKATGGIYRRSHIYNGSRQYMVNFSDYSSLIDAVAFERDRRVVEI